MMKDLTGTQTPGEAGFVMPAETAPHAACWMAWPHQDGPDGWGDGLAQAQRGFVTVARAIAAFEPVRVCAHPDAFAEARAALPAAIDVIALAQDDLWLRDTGPLFVQDAQGRTLGANLIFNNWGGKFPLGAGDRDIAENLLKRLHVPAFHSALCGEGGGLISDGRGTVITTETCLLNPNRNPGMTRAEVEAELFHAIGAKKVIWLPGDEAEWITDGHIDGMLTFTRPGHVLFEDNPDPDHPHHRVCRENLRALRGQTDADGREIQITLLNEAYLYQDGSDASATSYVNCYIANGGVIIPRFATPETDDAALQVFQTAFPDRRIAQVDIRDICWNGGGIHCMTQQQPA